jgi:hypothetical protein
MFMSFFQLKPPDQHIFFKIQSHNIYYNYNTCINNRVQLIKTHHLKRNDNLDIILKC